MRASHAISGWDRPLRSVSQLRVRWLAMRADSLTSARIRLKPSATLKKKPLQTKARSVTFKECAEAYMAAHEPSWKNAKHREQWHSTLRRCLYPKFGGVPVSTVSTEMVLDALQPIWHAMPETARKVRGRIEVVIDWAKTKGAFSGENPARWRGHLTNLLPKPSKIAPVVHHPALPFEELPAFISDLRGRSGLSSRALEFVILTAVRTEEALGARWEEFDLERTVWTVPAVRMKGSKEHRVPLSRACDRNHQGTASCQAQRVCFSGPEAGETSQQYVYVDASSPDEPRRPYRSRFPIDLPRLGR